MKKIFVLIFAIVLFFSAASKAFAHCESGFACSTAMDYTSGIMAESGTAAALKYDYSFMETLKQGKDTISPNEVLNKEASEWPAIPLTEMEASVSTKTIVRRYTLLASHPIDEKIRLLISVPYLVTDMKMRELTRDTAGIDTMTDMNMDTVSGLGDITVIGLYTAYTDREIRPGKRLTIGFGIKTPTGKSSEKTDDGEVVHTRMQPGTGSWDPIFLIDYMRGYYPFILQADLLYHLSTDENGDQLSADLIARYQASRHINLGIELNGAHTGNDKHGQGSYSSVFITPALEVKIPNTNGSAWIKFQRPIYQYAEGIQQVVDWRASAAITWNF